MSIESITQAAAQQGTAGASASRISSDIDDFLLILTTQLQNQDPLSPLESNEFTNQLVQFANVEQSINQSKKLEDLIVLQRRTEMSEAVNLAGKIVKYDHNEFQKTQAGPETLEYTLPEDAKNAAIYVFDQEGNPLLVSPVEKTAGTHEFIWDGKNGAGASFLSGYFHFEVLATGENGDFIEDIGYSSYGRVEGVEFGATETTLRFGDLAVPHGKLEEVYNQTPAEAVYYNYPPSEEPTGDNSSSADSGTGEGTGGNTETSDGNTDSNAGSNNGDTANNNTNPDEATS